MPRPYVMYPDARLRAVAEPVDAVTDEVRAIWDEMLEAMYAMPGVGLAAPQLGIQLRLAVLDCSPAKTEPVRLANPVLISASDAFRKEVEGSPNLPGVADMVERPGEVSVRYLDEHGGEVERSFTDLWSASVQHQIDHLDGRLFFDRLTPARRQRLLAKYRKAAKKQARAR
ncbi:MAG: peptide deformylase [Pseudomonadota bacterium]